VSFGWHPREHRAALDGMLMLTLEERGAYNTCLDLIYDREGPIQDDARWLAGWMGVSLRKWASLRASLIVKGKIFAVNLNGVDCLMNRRAAVVIETQTNRSRNLSESGAKGGRKTAELNTKANENKVGEGSQAEAIEKDNDSKEGAKAPLSPKGDAKGKYPEAFETCWKAYPHVKGRSSKPKSFAQWRRIPTETRSRLPVAIERYSANGREPKEDCGAPAMDRWLRDGRYLDWLEEDASTALRKILPFADEEIRNAIVSAKDEPFVRSWLDPCGWDAENRIIVPHSGLAATKLRAEVARIIEARKASIGDLAA
jgi:uncharacterized protein YdaU (DUF1376 family)